MAGNRTTLTNFLKDVAVYHDLRDRNNIYKTLINISGSNARANEELANGNNSDEIDSTFDNIIQGTEGILPWADYTPEAGPEGTQNQPELGYAQILNEAIGDSGDQLPDYLANAFKFVGNWNTRITSALDALEKNKFLYDKTNVSLSSIIYGNNFPPRLAKEKIDCVGEISPQAPIVNIHEYKAWWLSRGVTDTNLVKFFAQGIPSVELSQAVPFFDLKIIDRTKNPVLTDGDTKRAGKGMSVVKFIKGFGEITETDAEILQAQLPESNPAAAATSTTGSFSPSVAGMELFTLPQTYQGPARKYIDLNEDGLGGETARKNSIIDPFRPLMTIKDFKYTIDVSYVTMPTIRGTLNIILHDKSRLHEIAPLIRPDQNGRQEFLIEFGWSHPNKNSVYGKFLNACRQTRKFIAMSSNYSFETNGQVNITINLISKGGNSFANELPSALPGDGAVDIFRELESTIKELQEKLSSNRDTTMAINNSFALGKFTSAGDLITVKSDDLTAIREQVGEFQAAAGNANDVVNKTLTAIDTACKNVESYREKVNDSYKTLEKYIDLSYTKQNTAVQSGAHDPWAECWDSVKGKPGMTNAFSTSTHISVGRLLSILCLPVLMKQERWDQIDMVYYPCNRDSYGLSYFPTIASIPIPKSEIKKQIKLFRQTRAPNPPLLTIVHLVLKFVKEFKGGDSGWGLGGALQSTVNPKTGKVETKYAKRVDKKLYNSKMTAQATQIYGGPRRLKNPSFKIDVETVPFLKDKTKSVLRISILDGANDSYRTYSDLIRSLASDASGILTKATTEEAEGQSKTHNDAESRAIDMLVGIGYMKKIDTSKIKTATGDNQITLAGNNKYAITAGASRIKHFLSTIMPTFKFGTEFSIIKSCAVSSNSDSALGMINLKRSLESADRPAGTEADDSVPFEVLPTTLGLTTVGCPFFRHMQQYFFDYQTNTSIDNVYIVTGVEHTISPGNFESTLKLSKVEFYGTFENIATKLSDLQVALAAKTQEG